MFKVGDEVSYGMHGRCLVTAIESKRMGDREMHFYAIKALKNPIMGKVPPKNAPSILVPVDNAEQNGLRSPMNKEQAEQALKILAEADTYFSEEGKWTARHKALEDVLKKGGFQGLAKVIGHLYVSTQRDPAPAPEMTKFYEAVYKNLIREIADAFEVAHKEADGMVQKSLRAKLQAAG